MLILAYIFCSILMPLALLKVISHLLKVNNKQFKENIELKVELRDSELKERELVKQLKDSAQKESDLVNQLTESETTLKRVSAFLKKMRDVFKVVLPADIEA